MRRDNTIVCDKMVVCCDVVVLIIDVIDLSDLIGHWTHHSSFTIRHSLR